MATKYQNLSDYNSDTMPDKEVVANQSYAIVAADWNPEITMAMLSGAFETLIKTGWMKKIQVIHVPGTFELTMLLQIIYRKENRSRQRQKRK